MSDTTVPVAIAAPRTHHKYGPSKMGYLSRCSAFTGKSGDNDYSEEGTFLHELTESMTKQVLSRKFATVLEQVTPLAKQHELSDEVASVLRFVAKKLDRLFALKPIKVVTEIDVPVKRLNAKSLNHGFLDILFIYQAKGECVGIICDYKFGRIPVSPAAKNYQGKNYWAGIMQKFPELARCGVCFIQPRLQWISEAMFSRAQLPSIIHELETIVDNAEAVQRDPANAQPLMAVGTYCDYCALAGECSALNNARGMAVARHQGLPLPPKFDGLSISKPEQLALALYWVNIIENGLGDVKLKAREAAEANGGEISCTLPNGDVVTYEMAERGHDRVLGNAQEIAEALQEFVSPNEVLGAAELAIGKLETIVKSAMVELAIAKGEKLTKKAAWEQVTATLEACGLLSRPNGSIRYLRQKRAPEKQLTEGKK